MVQRRRFPAPNAYTISVATERMKDGEWSSVATIHQTTPTSEGEAESFELNRALEWIEQNTPSAARA
jgi:hypothetical protein